MELFDLINIDVVTELLKFSSLAMVLGIMTILCIELISYGVMKALSWLRL